MDGKIAGRRLALAGIRLLAFFFLLGVADCRANIVTLADHSFEPGLSMDFEGSFGDQDGSFAGEITTNPRTGTQHYFADFGNNGNGIGFGGTFSGVRVDPANFGPIGYGDELTTSIYLAANAADQPTGGDISLLFEFLDAGDNVIFVSGPAAPIQAASLGTNYSQFSHSYSLNAGDLPDLALVASINATVLAINANNTADGQVFMDDFQFLFNDPPAVPEPGFLIPMIGMVGLRLLRRRKKN